MCYVPLVKKKRKKKDELILINLIVNLINYFAPYIFFYIDPLRATIIECLF